jgi:hypothetical protein
LFQYTLLFEFENSADFRLILLSLGGVEQLLPNL